METCHALARARARRDAVVRPDTHAPARDPFAFYGLPPIDGSTIDARPVAGPAPRGGSAISPSRCGRAHRRAPAPTSSSPATSASRRCCCGFRAAAAAARLRVARLRAGRSRRRCRRSSRPRRRRRRASCARLARARGARSGGAPTATSRSRAALARRAGRALRRARPRVAVVPDGVRARRTRGRSRGRRRPAPGRADSVGVRRPPVCRGRAWTCCSRRSRALPDVDGLIVGGHAARTRPGARRRRWRSSSGMAHRVTFTGLVAPPQVARSCSRRRRAGAAEPGVRDLEPLHLAAQAVRVHGRGPADRRLGSAGAPRGAVAGRERACSCTPGERAGAGRRHPPAARRSGASPHGSRARALDAVAGLLLGAPGRAARGALRTTCRVGR